MRERDIEKYLVKRVKELGGEVRKVKWIGRTGAPDRLVMMTGCAPVWIELKATGKKLEHHQSREISRMIRMGMNVIMIDHIELVDHYWAKR